MLFAPCRGDKFTPHHMVVDYFQYVAANSDRVQLMEYGRTNEERPWSWHLYPRRRIWLAWRRSG
ncbi:MAG: hypothetical protein H6561_12180 [Lewinellaceae bacterium]|nr:hypothetical protein [Lewinellaceae bacterium]